MTPTKLGEPFSELFDQFAFVVDSACEPDMEDAPAIFIRWAADYQHRFANLPNDPRTVAVRGDYEGVSPIASLWAVRLRDGAETPAVIGSRLFQHRESVINGGILGASEESGQKPVGGLSVGIEPEGNTFGLRSRLFIHLTGLLLGIRWQDDMPWLIQTETDDSVERDNDLRLDGDFVSRARKFGITQSDSVRVAGNNA
jgi:hypothetical protein